MNVHLILNLDNTISLYIQKGHHLPKWADSYMPRFNSSISIYDKATLEKFINDYEQNGAKYTEGGGASVGLVRDQIQILNPEQLRTIYNNLVKVSKFNSDNQLEVSPKNFKKVKVVGTTMNLDQYEELSTAHGKGAAAGALSEHVPPEIGEHIGFFLDTKSAGNLARTNKYASNQASQNLEKQARKLVSSEITFDEFKNRYMEQYQKETFKNPFGEMKSKIEKNQINTIEEVQDYVEAHPNSRASMVLNKLIAEHASKEDENTEKVTRTFKSKK